MNSSNVFGAAGSGGLAFGNPIIIEKIVGFLNEGDFCRLYDSSQIFKNKIDQMDDIFWRREARKLATVLRKKNRDFLEEQWPKKTMREIFFILKEDVERLVAKIKGIFDPHPYPLKVTHIADAASLAHHGFLDSVRVLSLKKVDLSSIPINHLASLVACVKDKVRIDCPRPRYDFSPILDNVKCEHLSITMLLLGKEYEALVRAMKTRVRKLSIGRKFIPLIPWFIEELKKYDGKGICEKVYFLQMYYVELHHRLDIELWVMDRKWQVLADKENYLLVQRKET